MSAEKGSIPVDVRTYLNIINRRKGLILLTTLAAVVAAILMMRVMPPVYVATALVRISQTQTENADYWHFQNGELLKNTYARLLTSTPILQRQSPTQAAAITDGLADALIQANRETGQQQGGALRQVVDERLAQLETELETEKQSLQTATDMLVGLRASSAATENQQALIEQQQATVGQLTASIQQKERTYGMLLNQRASALATELVPLYTVSIIQPADLPTAPGRPRVTLGLMLAALLGLLGGIGLALLLETIDTTLHTPEQIGEAAQMHTLAEVPQAPARRVSAWMDGASPQGEAFRRLRTNILAVKLDPSAPPRHSLLIASAQPREGKSTIAANLARALAAAGQRVILIDGDLRRPVQHQIFGLPNGTGLSTVLQETMRWQVVVCHSQIVGLDVLPSGPLPKTPFELLASPEMATLLGQLEAAYDMVLLDSPAALAVADATVLAPLVDGVLLVVGRDQVRQEALQALCTQLAAVDAHLIGVVVNRTLPSRAYVRAHYYAHKGG